MTKAQFRKWNSVKRAMSLWSMVYTTKHYSEVINMMSHLERIISTRGVASAIEYNKAVRLGYTKWASGDSRPSVRIKFAKNGCPLVLTRIIPSILKSHTSFSIVLTVLSAMRVFEGVFKPDLSDITKPSLARRDVMDRILEDVPSFRKEVINVPKNRVIDPIKFDGRWLYTTKMGPSGPALHSIYNDVKNIIGLQDHIRVLGGDLLHTELLNSNYLVNTPKLWEEFKTWFKFLKDENSPIHARIAAIPSPEGKTRIIAIGDYWTQNALFLLHKWIFKILRNIPQDITFAQEKGLTSIQKPTGHSFWSIDLKAATDRFPMALQKDFLANLFGEEYSSSWAHIIRQPFHQAIDRSGPVVYGAGQPMGYYSSWAIFTLTHHLVIHSAGKQIGLDSLEGLYVILGDDVVIAHDDLASKYLSILSGLGVEVSSAKTHKSPTHFEIGKRWITDKGERSPFPVVALSQSKSWIPAILNCINEGSKKGWFTPKSHRIVAVKIASLYKRNVSIGFINHLYTLACISDSFMQAYRGERPSRASVREMANRLGINWTSVHAKSADALISKSVNRLVTKKTIRLWDDEIAEHPAVTVSEQLSEAKNFKPAEIDYKQRSPLSYLLRKEVAIYDYSNPTDYRSTDFTEWKNSLNSLIGTDPATIFLRKDHNKIVVLSNKVQANICAEIKKIEKDQYLAKYWTDPEMLWCYISIG